MKRRIFISSLIVTSIIILFIKTIYYPKLNVDPNIFIDNEELLKYFPKNFVNYNGKEQDLINIKSKIGSSNNHDIAKLFEGDIILDYKLGRVFNINGWIISKTECLLIEVFN